MKLFPQLKVLMKKTWKHGNMVYLETGRNWWKTEGRHRQTGGEAAEGKDIFSVVVLKTPDEKDAKDTCQGKETII